jgi:hypothetical protein
MGSQYPAILSQLKRVKQKSPGTFIREVDCGSREENASKEILKLDSDRIRAEEA